LNNDAVHSCTSHHASQTTVTYHVNKAIYEASLLPDNPQGRLHTFHKDHPLRTWLLESCVRKSLGDDGGVVGGGL